jgi:hypothetical protein
MSSFPPPEGDGVVDSIYHYLWTKNTQLETCPNVVIPNTVVYKYRQPAYWYYSSSDQQMKMRKKGEMTNQKIYESFRKRKNPSCEVVAYYISTRESDEGKEMTSMEYFDDAGLNDFLFNRQKEHNGIIQKFIDPKGKSNAIIRAIWSPKLCLLEQRVNLKPINDGRYDIYDRCVTYEGAEHQSMNAPVRGIYLPSRLQTICDSIVDHVMRTSSQHYRISRMVLNFKLDHNNKLWLLWCSSMRLAADKYAIKKPFPVNISGDITVPDKCKDSVFRNSNLPSTFFKEKYFICPGSGEIVDAEDSFDISYKTAIASWEDSRRKIRAEASRSKSALGAPKNSMSRTLAPGLSRSPSPSASLSKTLPGKGKDGLASTGAIDEEEDSVIPPLLKVIDKDLTVERYKRLLGSSDFLSQKVRVSFPTYMKYTKSVVESPDIVLERMIVLKNTEDLGLEPPKEKESPLMRKS